MTRLGPLAPGSNTLPRRATAKLAVTLFPRPRTHWQWRLQYAVARRLWAISEWADYRAGEWILQLEAMPDEITDTK